MAKPDLDQAEATWVGRLLSMRLPIVDGERESMGTVEQLAEWRARRARKSDVPIGSPPFVLEEPCPGCGATRVSTMVWRDIAPSGRVPFPRIEPHFLCRDGRVLWQEITDAPIPLSRWSRILGHFEESKAK